MFRLCGLEQGYPGMVLKVLSSGGKLRHMDHLHEKGSGWDDGREGDCQRHTPRVLSVLAGGWF